MEGVLDGRRMRVTQYGTGREILRKDALADGKGSIPARSRSLDGRPVSMTRQHASPVLLSSGPFSVLPPIGRGSRQDAVIGVEVKALVQDSPAALSMVVGDGL